MSAPQGNKNAVGNKGGRPPLTREHEWHLQKWAEDIDVQALEEKVKSKNYSPRDIYLLKALKADTMILKNLADKVLADLHEHSGPGRTPLFLPSEILTKHDIKADSADGGTKESSE